MIGTTVSHYRIVEKLGEGGMGVVYLAEDTRLDRKVALKFLSAASQQDPAARRRFLREAKAAAAIDHPYICKVYGVEEAGGLDFIAQEYLEGRPLGERLRHGPLPLEKALQLAVEIAEAIEKAHRQGIVHRDLKPANVMISSEGHAKVMDFGLAKPIATAQVSRQADTLTALTRAGVAPGTPAYMSPEQLRGEDAGPASDIFSFGIVFQEMLTGVHPFRRGSANETVAAVLASKPAELSIAEAPKELRAVLARMLAKSPGDRFPSFEAVLDALRPLLRGASVARRPSLGAWPVPVAGLAVLLALLLGIQLSRGAPEPTPAGAAPDVAALKLQEYETTAEGLMQNFADPEALEMSIEAWDKALALHPHRARPLAGKAMARTLLAWNSLPEGGVLDLAESEAERALDLDPSLATPYVALCFLYAMRGLVDTADEMSRRSLELAPEDPWVLQARARILIDMHGRFAEAEELAVRATELDPIFFPAWFQLGWARLELERFAESEAAFRRAIEIRPDFVAGYMGMGVLLDAMGRHEEALASFALAQEQDPDSIQCLMFSGHALHALGRHQEALASLRRLWRESPEHPLARYATLFAAVELRELGHDDESEEALRSAERVFKSNLHAWFNLAGMAGVATQRGDERAGLAWLRQAVDAGMRSVVRLLTDPSLEPLAGGEEFQKTVDQMRREGRMPAVS